MERSVYLHMPETATESKARVRILDTASDLFYRHGIRAVGVDTIVEESGVAKMTLYKHFASKEVLVGAVLARRGEEWIAKLRGRVEELSPEPGGRLVAVFDVLEEWFRTPDFRGCVFINSALETADREHPVSRACLDHKRRIRSFLVELATQTGAVDPRALAEQVMLLVEGSTVGAAMWGLAEPARRAKQAAQALVEFHRNPKPRLLRT